MLSLITPDNLPATLTAIGGLIGGGGLITLIRIRREPPRPGTPDAAAVALAENTKALQAMADALDGQNGHFAANNKMFEAMGPMLGTIVHDTAENKSHLAAIRDAMNRRG